MPPGGRERWRRRVLKAERDVQTHWRELRRRDKLLELDESWQRTQNIRNFGKPAFRAVISMLTDHTDTAYLGLEHPLVAQLRGTGKKRARARYINKRQRPDTHFIARLKCEQWGPKELARRSLPGAQLRIGIHRDDLVGAGNDFYGGAVDALTQGRDYDTLELRCFELDEHYSLHQPFAPWLLRERTITLRMFTETVFKDLPLDIKQIIVRHVRDSRFNALMDAAGVSDS